MMENFNSQPKRIYNWNQIRHDVAEETPDETEFTDVYGERGVQADLRRIDDIKRQLNIKEEQGISDSRVQEYATAQEIGEMDWFRESARADQLFPDDKGQQTAVFLTSEYDDFVNHIDAIAVMNNAESDFRAVPFALDMTYNVDNNKLTKKFGWKHPRLGMPGIATAKYFEDTFSIEPEIEKGRIDAMPRFVIGFSPDLSHEITELRMTSTGWDAPRRNELTSKAKWCVLRELSGQAKQMLKALEIRKDDPTFKKLYDDVAALDRYFDGAIKTSKDEDRSHPDFISYPDRDEVCQAIMAKI